VKTLLLLTAVFIGLVFIPAAHADSSPSSTLYQYTLSDITFVGNNACGGPCVETFSVSFELDYVDGYGSIVPGTSSIVASGPLTNLTCCEADWNGGYIVVGTDQTDIHNLDYGAEFDIVAEAPIPGTNTNFVEMYSCTNGTCSADFCTSETCSYADAYGYPICFNCGIEPQSGTITIAAVPEPPLFALTLAGLLPLALVKRGFELDVRRPNTGWCGQASDRAACRPLASLPSDAVR
jgi:hypothetical protein